MDTTDMIIEVPVSTVVTSGFPKPAVETEEATLVAPDVLLMAAAVPPPAMIANAQVTTGLKSATVDTITAVPAMVARGIAIESNRLSTKGI